VVNYDQTGGTRLMLQLRELKYSTSTGFWAGGVEVAGALKATASDGSAVYEKLYRTDKKTRVVVVPIAGKNQKWLNSALSDLLRQVFDDSGLSHFLTQAASTGKAGSIASAMETAAPTPVPPPQPRLRPRQPASSQARTRRRDPPAKSACAKRSGRSKRPRIWVAVR
jgi:hypothetical protein